jgi:hypothetical protein
LSDPRKGVAHQGRRRSRIFYRERSRERQRQRESREGSHHVDESDHEVVFAKDPRDDVVLGEPLFDRHSEDLRLVQLDESLDDLVPGHGPQESRANPKLLSMRQRMSEEKAE